MMQLHLNSKPFFVINQNTGDKVNNLGIYEHNKIQLYEISKVGQEYKSGILKL
jgi:hypothetical protein